MQNILVGLVYFDNQSADRPSLTSLLFVPMLHIQAVGLGPLHYPLLTLTRVF